MKIKLISKLITIKLIALLFVCPFITYGMNNLKRKRGNDTTQPQSKVRCPQEIEDILYALYMGLSYNENENKYNCKYKNCTQQINYQYWIQLRTHLINDHVRCYKCTICKEILPRSHEDTTRCINNKKHRIEQCPLTQERYQEFLNGLNGFAINIEYFLYKPNTTEKQKELITKIIQKAFQRNQNYTCPICNNQTTYQKRNGLEGHLISAHIQPYTCSQCKEKVLATNFLRARNMRCDVGPQSSHKIIINELTDQQEKELLKQFGLHNEESIPTSITPNQPQSASLPYNTMLYNIPSQRYPHNNTEQFYSQSTPAPLSYSPALVQHSPPLENTRTSSTPSNQFSQQEAFKRLIDKYTSNPQFNNLLTDLITICKKHNDFYSCKLHDSAKVFLLEEDFKKHLFISHLQANKCIHCNLQDFHVDECRENGTHDYPPHEGLYRNLEGLCLQLIEIDVLKELRNNTHNTNENFNSGDVYMMPAVNSNDFNLQNT